MIDLSKYNDYKFNFVKLLNFGFEKVKNNYIYEKEILDEFLLKIYIDEKNKILLDLKDKDGERVDIFFVKDTQGSFVGNLNLCVQEVLDEIVKVCAENEIFKEEQAKIVIDYIFNKYGDELEFLWKKFPKTAIWRRKNNNKWYGILMTVQKTKLGFSSNEVVEVLDLRADPNICNGKTIFPGFHMNKKSWITICLDKSLEDDEIFKLIDQSYLLANKKVVKCK